MLSGSPYHILGLFVFDLFLFTGVRSKERLCLRVNNRPHHSIQGDVSSVYMGFPSNTELYRIIQYDELVCWFLYLSLPTSKPSYTQSEAPDIIILDCLTNPLRIGLVSLVMKT